MLIVNDSFRGKWLGSALQIYFIADNLAMLVGPMVNTLFVRQRNTSLVPNCVPRGLGIIQPSAHLRLGILHYGTAQ